ncbi:tyrosinase family protein [Agrobacterium vitis]|uniref:tyrosinase family protein n=1 Tax=Agrobacterium vitis TaxID=373 RepID=UPI00203520C8|nr:tyrosinase family protein [Agrobacterium vitis]MCM2451583.1 tyrosinase family protein [Agrobacterium vitis]
MVYVRKSVWANGGDFSDPILYWYAKGVGKLREKPLADKTSWNFMAAIHGIDIDKPDQLSLWTKYGYYTAGEPLPSQADQKLYWKQCQHGSWYFLPWHRGYIWSIEALVRAQIVALGGPADWAMPYWNYSDTANHKARVMPPAFAQETFEGAPNPLYIKQRYGSGKTPIIVPYKDVTLEALLWPIFTGVSSGGSPGFGGVKTGFSHNSTSFGLLESKPHNLVHIDIGGYLDDDPDLPGLMSKPNTAGLDPIFWLHHANIDRLWAQWNAESSLHKNPTDPAWLNGPQERQFVVPNPDGTPYYYKPSDMLETKSPKLNYTYQQFVVAQAPVLVATTAGGKTVAEPKTAELIGANEDVVALAGEKTPSVIRLDDASTALFAAPKTLALGLRSGDVPLDRYFLNLENIRAQQDGFVIDVYLNLPDDADHAHRLDLHAGSIGLFGVSYASKADSSHGGKGVTQVLDITTLLSGLIHSGDTAKSGLSVHLVPRIALGDDAKVTVERISLYRQPG